ncbi:MAG: ABC transporter ATP-binding protein [Acidobacteriota bacterium]|nr:ABC transporter ATP-binding protein [Acidobacteriota bacterium]
MIEARIAKTFLPGPESAAFALDVEFQAGPGVTVLFGPSGSGKTLTLDCIAGFTRPDRGRILLDDQILFDAAAAVNFRPQARHCGYVFQNYALFPHMTLRQNLMFAAERQPRLERRRRVNEMLERFHLREFAGRRPHEVSGGQKQRCSIARALISNPRLLLFDEPARGLDAPLRIEFYALLRELRSEFRIPMLLVTHDIEECLAVGDALLVYDAGRIAQSGTPHQVAERPANQDVARLLGIGNLFEAEILALDPGRRTSRIRVGERELTGAYFPGHFRGDRVSFYVRPQDVSVHPEPGDNRIPATLLHVFERVESVRLEFLGGISAEVPRSEYERQKDNEAWQVEFPPSAIRLL